MEIVGRTAKSKKSATKVGKVYTSHNKNQDEKWKFRCVFAFIVLSHYLAQFMHFCSNHCKMADKNVSKKLFN